MAEVTIKNVSKIYPGNVKAVDSISLEIKDKEFMILVGPSGCGKSTTLRMIAGLEDISEGTISIGTRVVNDVPPKDRNIAMVFQNYALYPHMSVYDNMAFGLKLRKFKKSEIEARVKDAADILDLHELLDRRPKALSGGQRQRVAVGRAIVRQPEAFLFDEPLSNLDAKMRVEMRAEISKLHTTLETTMIYVTHDQVEAMTMGDRITVMKGGIIQQVANPIELYENPVNLFVASFIGTPPMNLFEGTLNGTESDITFDEGSFSFAIPEDWRSKLTPFIGKEVTLGLRPEHIASKQSKDGDFPKITANIEVVEPMGPETFLYLKTSSGNNFIAKIDAHDNAEVGQSLDLPVFLPKAHFFDKESTNVIV